MVNSVSIVKKNKKTIRKLVFSMPVWGELEPKIGFKKTKAIPILNVVSNINVNPTFVILTWPTLIKINNINVDNKKKKPYSFGNV